MSNTYFEVVGTHEGASEVLFGSFDRKDCTYELDAERDSWKAEGYKGLKITSRETDEAPDPEVYDLLPSDAEGYPLIYVSHDGSVLCAACMTKWVLEGYEDRDAVSGSVHWEGEALHCEGCNEVIESAYGPVESHTTAKWSGSFEPMIGDVITVNFNGIGDAEVLGYDVVEGWKAVIVRPLDPPPFLIENMKQDNTNSITVFGAEIKQKETV